MTRSDRVRTALSVRARPVLDVARWALWAAGLCLLPTAALAQNVTTYGAPSLPSEQRLLAPRDWSDEVPAHVSVVSGDAQFERDGTVEPLDENMPLLSGDRIRTGRGRVEVLFADGSVLDLDESTDVAFLSDNLLRMAAGRVRLLISRSEGDANYRVDAAGTIAWLLTAGEYRVAIDARGGTAPEVRLGVLRGAAELESPAGRTALRAGDETASTMDTAPMRPYATIASSRDAFDIWIEQQYDERAGARSISAQYLPADLRYYGSAFDRDGSWLYEPSYGYVWYPRVPVTWVPYSDGRWTFAGAIGWTWVGAGRWTWPTHHYGRWGTASGRWYWIPDRRWAPAWVSWSSSPGYVGWCPLGYDNRPVASITTITTYTTTPGRAWTVVPAPAFGRSFAVRSHALNAWSVPATERFAFRGDGPSRPPAARADVQPVRGPSLTSRSYAVPRDRSTAGATPRTPPSYSPWAPSLPASRTAPPNDRPSPPTRPREARPSAEPSSQPAAEAGRAHPIERDAPAAPPTRPSLPASPDPPSRRVEPRREPQSPPSSAPAPPSRGGAESAPPDRDSGGSRPAPPDPGDRGRAHGRDRR